MSQNLESILAAAQQLPPEELRQLIDHLLSDVSSELQADDQLRQESWKRSSKSVEAMLFRGQRLSASTNYDTSIGMLSSPS